MNQTTIDQSETQEVCRNLLRNPNDLLYKNKHAVFLFKGLEPLNSNYVSLDASRPWMMYWTLNALSLLEKDDILESSYFMRAVESINACQHPDGGYGGGYGQIAHLACTYAAVLSLAIIGKEEGFAQIDRNKMYDWIKSLKQSNGGFAVHHGGEVDARAAYLALTVASLLNILTDELTQGTAAWLSKCQRYEGGLSGVHNAEAHAGLTYCAIAALCILGSPLEVLRKNIECEELLKWLCARQLDFEGGFSGRTNKLVDGCYSWWVGALFPMVESALNIKSSLFSSGNLSRYILSCCQGPRGGLRDKPTANPDLYHSCYCLAGLSLTQHTVQYDESQRVDNHPGWESFSWIVREKTLSRSNKSNYVKALHPLYTIPQGCAEKMRGFFHSRIASS